jgi:hypothetical protein
VQGNGMEIKKLKKTYVCDCNKEFQSASGIWKHKKVCNIETESINTDIIYK